MKRAFLSILAGIALLTCAAARSETVIKSATGTELTDGASWVGGIAPGDGETAFWNTNSLCQDLTVGNYTFLGGISIVGAQTNIDISGTGLLNLDRNGIDMSSAGVNVSIANNIALVTSQTWTVGSTNTLTIGGYVDGFYNLYKNGPGTLVLDGINPMNGVLTVNGGTAVINGVLHAYEGWQHIDGLTVNPGGTVFVSSGHADSFLGSCNYDAQYNTINGGDIQFGTSSGASEPINRAFAIGPNDGSIEVLNTNATLTFNYFGDEFQFYVPSAVNIVLTGAGNGVMNKIISGGGGLIKNGSGTWTLGANNSYTGNTTVSNGILVVNGSVGNGNVTVESGAVLGGTGAIGGPIVFLPGAMLQLTYGATLAVSGPLNLNDNTVHLLLSDDVPAGVYLLATYHWTGSFGTLRSLPVIDSGSLAAGNVAHVTISGGNVNLVVGPPVPHLEITSINGGSNPIAGTGFDVVVQVLDADENPYLMVTDTNITLSLNAGSGALGGTLTGTIPAGANSVTISGVTYSKAEAGVVMGAVNTGGTLPAAGSSSFTVVPGAAATIAIASGNNLNGIPGIALPVPFVVVVTDSDGNPVPGVGVNFAISSTPAGAAGQLLSASSGTTGADGRASTTLTFGNAPGTYMVAATSGILNGSPVTFTATAANDGWRLAWSDDFDYNGLPDSTKWGYESGYNVRNGESEYYTTNRLENAMVTNGMLVITARHEAYTPPPPNTGNYDYTSASITSQYKESFLYGRIEMRAKIPTGQGIWPAFWMLGTNITSINWPACGEVDIMEYVGRDPDTIHGNAYYTAFAANGYEFDLNPFEDFHTYAIEWDSSDMRYYFDNTNYFSFHLDDAAPGATNAFRNPQYLLMNLALGGGYGGNIDNSVFPQQYLIDYVRVYKKSPVWTGAGTNDYWSTPENWPAGAPLTGDLVVFSGNTRMTPAMDGAYNLNGLKFEGAAGGYVLGAQNGGVLTLSGSGVNNSSASLQTLNLPIILGANQLFNTAAGDLLMGGGISGNGFGLCKVGPGRLTLGGTNTYTGNTCINAGTLALGLNGSLASSSGITIAQGATFDVSASGGFTMGVGNPLVIGGVGTNAAASSALINAGHGGSLNMVSNAITVSYDGANPALYIPQGILSLGYNAFTVNTTNEVPLLVGTYAIILQGAGNVTNLGAFPAVNGTAIGNGLTGSISVVGGSVNLVISAGSGTPVFANLSPSVGISYGTSTVTLAGTLIGPETNYPAPGDSISVTIDGNTQTTTINDNTGDFSINFDTTTLPAGASPYSIVYSYSGNSQLFTNANVDVSTSVIVNKAVLSITANNASKTYDGTAFSGGNGVTCQGFFNGDSLSSLTGSLVYGGSAQGAVNAGNYTITPSGFSSPNYSISYNNGTLTVNPLGITAAANPITKVYGTADPVLTFQFTPGLLGGDSFTGAVARVAGENVGNYMIGQGTLALNSNYSLTYVGTNFSITPASLTITANNLIKSYGQTNTFAGTEFTAGGLIPGDSITNVTLSSAGSAATATVASSPFAIVPGAARGTGLGNYNINYVNGTLSVIPALLGVTANDTNRAYGATNPVFTATFTGFVNGESPTNSDVAGEPELTTIADTNSVVGAYDIIATLGTLTSTNYTFSLTNGILTINPAAITVTAQNQTRAYGAANPPLTYSYGGFINGDTASVISGAPVLGVAAGTNSPVGGYGIIVGPGNLSATNYSFTLVNGTLNVTPALLGVTANDTNRAYGATNPVFTATFTGFVNGESPTNSDVAGEPELTTIADTNSVVGAYGIIATLGTLTSTNYTFSLTNGTLTINPAAITVTAQNQTRAYGAANPPLTYSYGGFINGDTASVISGAPVLGVAAGTNSPVGGYGIIVGPGNLSATNYSFTLVNGTLNVTPALLGVTANDTNRAYGATNPVFTATFTGFVNGESPTNSDVAGEPELTTIADTNSVIGAYDIVATLGTLTSTNYTFSLTNGILTINPAAITVTAQNQTRAYGAANPPLTYSYGGFINGDTASVISGAPVLGVAAGNNSPVGGYGIIVGPGNLSATNYSFTLVNGTLTVIPALLGVTANDTNRAYGATNPVFTATFTGFVNGESPTNSDVSGEPELTTIADTNSVVGAYDIIATLGTLTSTNYTFSLTNGTLTINPAAITVTAQNQTRAYGAANPPLTYSYGGFINGDTASIISGAPVLGVAAGTNSPVGNYPIAISIGNLSATNYMFNLTGGTLGVTPASLTVSANNASKVYGQTLNFAGTEFSLAGLVVGDSVTNVTLQSDGASPGAAVGNYPIVPGAATGGGLENYNITYSNGVLSVTAPTPVTVNPHIVMRNGAVMFTFTGGDNGTSYRFQASDDFITWTNLTTIVAGSNGLASYYDNDATNHIQRFYRTVTP